MLRRTCAALCAAALLLAAGAGAAQPAQASDAAPAATAQPEAVQREADAIYRDVMSPFCPGLTLADCPSQQAFDLRADISRRLRAGESRDAIVDELVATYGTAILSDPSDTPIGRIVWGVPILLAVIAAGVLALFLRRVARGSRDEPAATPADAARLDARLDDELRDPD
ncbi:MAG: cytochrome c-type biogenesis protein [Vicinamibacterales bacterium]